jgi:hypothetical protein
MAEKVIKSISSAIKGLKGQQDKLGIKRKLNPASRHDVALVRLIKAMTKRGWASAGSGVYRFRKRFEVKTHSDHTKGFHVLVEDVKIADTVFTLELGQGAINELDEFVGRSEIIASASTSK